MLKDFRALGFELTRFGSEHFNFVIPFSFSLTSLIGIHPHAGLAKCDSTGRISLPMHRRQPTLPHAATRVLAGCLSLLGMALHPAWGDSAGQRLLNDLRTPCDAASTRELVLVLPGIEGESFLNHNIARGLADGGVESAIEIFDWTTGIILLFLYHLRGKRRHISQADRLVHRIVAYRQSHPGRPVHLVGHSGGAAMIVLTLERLPLEYNVSCAVLLQSALSPDHDLTTALERTERGIWNVRSVLDVFFLGVGTWITGTPRRTAPPSAAGMVRISSARRIGSDSTGTLRDETA